MNKINYNLEKISVDELTSLIAYHNDRYWQDNQPEIADDEYDRLMRKLAELAPGHPLLSAVIAPNVSSMGKVRHPEPMLSLDKAYSLEEVVEWARKFARAADEPLLVEPKYDGISARFDGRILSTRGDGEIGEDISDKIPLIELEAADYRGALPPRRTVRGEIVIRSDDFRDIYAHIKRKGGTAYKNQRNAAAGIMGLKDIADVKRQGARLTLVDYDLISRQVALNELPERWLELVEDMEQLPYPLDGIVIKFADRDYAASLGNTAHHPRGAIAFKFSNIRRESKLLGVEWSFGKNCLTPVALLEPVEIGGTTIKRASLHNAQNIIDMDLQINDTVTVERAGDVIPHVVASVPGADRHSCMIDVCPNPQCGARLERNGPELCCPNPECSETLLCKLCAAVRSVGIENLGEPNIRRMMQTLHVRTLHDIFSLRYDDILRLDSFAEKSAENLYNEINAARNVNDYQLLASLNVPHVGINVAKTILANHSFAEIRRMTPEEFAAIDGVGPERANALCRELIRQADFLDGLLPEINLLHSATDELPTVCFTGKMPEKRSFYEDIARARGMEPVDNVNSSLSLLVAADLSGDSSKLRKAAKLGIKTMLLNDFLNAPITHPSPPPTPPTPPTQPISAPQSAEDDGEQLSFGF